MGNQEMYGRPIRFTAHNFKRTREVELVFDDHILKLQGLNSQGKSSTIEGFLNCLEECRQGDMRLIHQGEDKADLKLEFEGFVIRKWFDSNKNRPSMKITSAQGATYSSPMQLIKKLTGDQKMVTPMNLAFGTDAESKRKRREALFKAFDFKLDHSKINEIAMVDVPESADVFRTIKKARQIVEEQRKLARHDMEKQEILLAGYENIDVVTEKIDVETLRNKHLKIVQDVQATDHELQEVLKRKNEIPIYDEKIADIENRIGNAGKVKERELKAINDSCQKLLDDLVLECDQEMDKSRSRCEERRRELQAQIDLLDKNFEADVEALNQRYERRKQDAIESNKRDVDLLDERIRNRVDELKEDLVSMHAALKDRKQSASREADISNALESKRKEQAEIGAEMAGADENNRKYEQTHRKYELISERDRAKTIYDECQGRIDSLDRMFRDMVASVDIPVSNISISEDGDPLINGLPYEDAGSADRLIYITTLLFLADPVIRVIGIPEASFLDDNNLEALSRFAKKQKLWFLIEQVRSIPDEGENVYYFSEGVAVRSDDDLRNKLIKDAKESKMLAE